MVGIMPGRSRWPRFQVRTGEGCADQPPTIPPAVFFCRSNASRTHPRPVVGSRRIRPRSHPSRAHHQLADPAAVQGAGPRPRGPPPRVFSEPEREKPGAPPLPPGGSRARHISFRSPPCCRWPIYFFQSEMVPDPIPFSEQPVQSNGHRWPGRGEDITVESCFGPE